MNEQEQVTRFFGVLINTLANTKHEINNCSAVIGRSSATDVQVCDRLVSREHALIVRMKGSYFIEDLGSTNGTRVNNELLTERTVLKPGDEIRIGACRLVFALEPSDNSDDGLAITVPASATQPEGARVNRSFTMMR